MSFFVCVFLFSIARRDIFRVREKEKKEKKKKKKKKKKMRPAAPANPTRTVFVRGLPHGTKESDLESYFGVFGEIRKMALFPAKSIAFVTFYDLRHAEVSCHVFFLSFLFFSLFFLVGRLEYSPKMFYTFVHTCEL